MSGNVKAVKAMSGIVKAGVQMTLTRTFDAPRELVFNTWVDEKHLQAWWGPAGSENGETRLDVRPGGEIHIHMRGPSFDHPMGGMFEEIDPPNRLVFLSKAFPNPDGSWKFVNRNTVTFEDLGGGRTKLILHCVVQQADDGVGIPVADMEAGWTGSLDRLRDRLAAVARATILFTRLLDAPRPLVFRMWTETAHLREWWGPRGSRNPQCALDPRPGGNIHIHMLGPQIDLVLDGAFDALDPPRGLTFTTTAFTLPNGERAKQVVTVRLDELDAGTRMTVQIVLAPLPAGLEGAIHGMAAGYGESLDRLREHLAKM